MRLFVLALAIILWLLLGFWYCQSKNECCGVVENSQTTIPPVAMVSGPILFNYDQGNPTLGQGWAEKKAEIVNGLANGKLLKITGQYRKDEINNSRFADLGIARAHETQMALGLRDDQVLLTSQLVDDKAGRTAPFTSVLWDYINKIKSVDESVADMTIIRFPYNSTDKLNDLEVETYLNKLAARIKSSHEKIDLTGHTDDAGEEAYNMRLGQSRADIIRKYLLAKGVPATSIATQSMGESKPVASNENENGRAENRRTELRIIK